MEAELPKSGRYVVAVSGGVDSVVLLDMLSMQPGLDLIVAHFDHGIREDSHKDLKLVGDLAKSYRLPFESKSAALGSRASEATARSARYDFLRKVMQKRQADAIITAHHSDDVLETAIINLIRGTGRKGLTALMTRPDVLRPLLNVSKDTLVSYATDQGLRWHEDSTNHDTAYLRNYVRHQILSKFSPADKKEMLRLINNLRGTNSQIDTLLVKQLQSRDGGRVLSRQWYISLPHSVSLEIMAAWLRRHGLAGFDSPTLERLAVAAKTARPGKKFPVYGGAHLVVSSDDLRLEQPAAVQSDSHLT